MDHDTLCRMLAIISTIWALWYFTRPLDRNDGK
jgi:hypothetical protein